MAEKMKDLILVTGSEGLVGSRFIEISESRTDFHAPTQIEMDITKPSEIRAILASYNFRTIVHFAAFTDVNEAEKQRGDKNGDCWTINFIGTKNLVDAVKTSKNSIHFIQISTDMVFSGSASDRGPYPENHPAEKNLAKLTWYGFTKAEAERLVTNNLGDKMTILRLIYPVRAHYEAKLDFIRKYISLYDEGKPPPLFDDQKISITFIDEACKVLDKIISSKFYGVYHAGSLDLTTPYELMAYVLGKVRGGKNVQSIHLDDFLRKTKGQNFRYPKFGGLTVENSQKKLGMKFTTWREIADNLISQGLK